MRELDAKPATCPLPSSSVIQVTKLSGAASPRRPLGGRTGLQTFNLLRRMKRRRFGRDRRRGRGPITILVELAYSDRGSRGSRSVPGIAPRRVVESARALRPV